VFFVFLIVYLSSLFYISLLFVSFVRPERVTDEPVRRSRSVSRRRRDEDELVDEEEEEQGHEMSLEEEEANKRAYRVQNGPSLCANFLLSLFFMGFIMMYIFGANFIAYRTPAHYQSMIFDFADSVEALADSCKSFCCCFGCLLHARPSFLLSAHIAMLRVAKSASCTPSLLVPSGSPVAGDPLALTRLSNLVEPSYPLGLASFSYPSFTLLSAPFFSAANLAPAVTAFLASPQTEMNFTLACSITSKVSPSFSFSSSLLFCSD
jgi:hypothetical protein